MANESHNPLSKLLDIDFPEVKKANWNTSYDLQTTADVGYAIPILTDRILANTHVKMDIDQASFANPTISPLYGRYRVKYLAFWAPDRLYIPPWRDGEVMVEDDYPYPYVKAVSSSRALSTYDTLTGNSEDYVPMCSLLSYLGMFPAGYTPSIWNRNDAPEPKNALPLLAFWDIYRHYIVNPQEDNFPIRIRAFQPSVIDDGIAEDARNPTNVYPSRKDLDDFFRNVRINYNEGRYDISSVYSSFLRHPLFTTKRVVYPGSHQSYDNASYRDALNIMTFFS